MARALATHTQGHEATVVRDVGYLGISISILFRYLRLGLQITQEGDILLITGVLESIAGVEDAEIVDVLDIALTKIKTHMESLCKEVKSVECLGLGFGNGWAPMRSREGLIPWYGS